MYFSCSAKKVTKEGVIGEALSVALPRAKAALSYVPLPAALGRCGGPYLKYAAQQKCSDFCCAGQYPSAPREILKRAHLTRGSAALAPLKSASFRTFLAETRKVHISF